MNSTFATRRLWLRRWHRIWSIIGIFVMWPLRLVSWYLGWWKKHTGEAFFVHIVIAFLGCLVGAISIGIYKDVRGKKTASADVLIAESKADPCFENTIKRRADVWKRPITVHDVWQLQEDCEKYWETKRVMAEQAKALK